MRAREVLVGADSRLEVAVDVEKGLVRISIIGATVPGVRRALVRHCFRSGAGDGAWVRALSPSCRIAVETVVGIYKEVAMCCEQNREPGEYRCPRCDSADVELCFPVWVKANAIEDRESWSLDFEAQPERDSEKGWCSRCEEHILVKRIEG